jgi:outer membrane protein
MLRRHLIACALSACIGYAHPVHADDLAAVVQQALDHDAELAQARAGYEAAKLAVPIARAGLLPQISGGWGRAYNRIDNELYPRQVYWQSGWMVNVTQPLFDWSKWTAYRQADYTVALGAVDLAAAEQKSMLRAVRAYFDELAAEDERMRSAGYLKAIGLQRVQVRRKRVAGEATLIDERESDAAYEQADLQATDADHELGVTRRAVQRLTGRPFSPLTPLPAGMTAPGLTDGQEVWAEQARTRGYEVQSKELGWKIAQFDSARARAAHYPVVSVTGSYTPAGAAGGYARPTTTTVGMLQIQIPLFSGGEIQARAKQSLALQDKAEQTFVAASIEAEAAARDDHARYVRERIRTDSLTHLVDTASDALRATEIGYKLGSRASTDVLRAIDTLYTAKRDLLRSRYETILAFLRLKADVATLSMADIDSMNAVLCCAPGTASR